MLEFVVSEVKAAFLKKYMNKPSYFYLSYLLKRGKNNRERKMGIFHLSIKHRD